MITITCTECNHFFQISEAKIPGPTFKAKCPACHKVFQVTIHENGKKPEAASEPNRQSLVSQREILEMLRPEMEALVKTQLDAVRADILLSLASLLGKQGQVQPGHSDEYSDLHALVCQPDAAVAQQIAAVLQRLKHSVQICSTASEALTRLEGGFFHVITTDLAFPDDREGGAKILGKINARKQDDRRKIFVVIVSDQIKTSGPQTAFFHGANIVVQKSDLSNFESLIQEGVRYYRELYSNYSKLLVQIGEL